MSPSNPSNTPSVNRRDAKAIDEDAAVKAVQTVLEPGVRSHGLYVVASFAARPTDDPDPHRDPPPTD